MLGFPSPDHLPSVLVSTKKGGESKYNNAYRRISAHVVSPSGAKARLHTALMHNMDMQQQYYGGNNHEASDPDSNGGYFSPGSGVDRWGTTGFAAGVPARQLSRSWQRCVHAYHCDDGYPVCHSAEPG